MCDTDLQWEEKTRGCFLAVVAKALGNQAADGLTYSDWSDVPVLFGERRQVGSGQKGSERLRSFTTGQKVDHGYEVFKDFITA